MIIPKIYSYRRSGTHLLMASIFHNFELPNNISKKMSLDNKSWNGKEVNGEEIEVPWSDLFGTHDVGSSYMGRGIYIYRHPMDTFYSHWVFSGKYPALHVWLEEKNIRHWKDQIAQALSYPLLKVRYEDLIDNFQDTMKNIQEYTGLNPKQTSFVPVSKDVGWDANKSGGHEHRSKFDQKSLDLVRKVLGEEIYGYKISID